MLNDLVLAMGECAWAKELAAEWKAEDAGMSWAPGMGSSDEEERG